MNKRFKGLRTATTHTTTIKKKKKVDVNQIFKVCVHWPVFMYMCMCAGTYRSHRQTSGIFFSGSLTYTLALFLTELGVDVPFSSHSELG